MRNKVRSGSSYAEVVLDVQDARKGDGMTDQVGVTFSQATHDRRTPVIETDGLKAEYSTGCTPTGEWFALGTISREHSKSTPAWVVVGTGSSKAEAVESLTLEIRAQAKTVVS